MAFTHAFGCSFPDIRSVRLQSGIQVNIFHATLRMLSLLTHPQCDMNSFVPTMHLYAIVQPTCMLYPKLSRRAISNGCFLLSLGTSTIDSPVGVCSRPSSGNAE